MDTMDMTTAKAIEYFLLGIMAGILFTVCWIGISLI